MFAFLLADTLAKQSLPAQASLQQLQNLQQLLVNDAASTETSLE